MSPFRLAWRNLGRGHRCNMIAIAISALAVCALDVLSGHHITVGASQLGFDAMACAGLAAVAAAIAATVCLNAHARRIEVATLRALGMRASAVFLMYMSEAVWLACLGIVGGTAGSGLAAWAITRLSPQHWAGDGAAALPALDGSRMLMVAATVLAITLLAALAPAFMAARANSAPSSA